MCLNSLTSTASADAGKNEALFAFWQVIGQSNDAAFRLEQFDKLYRRSIALPDSPERNALYRDMNRLFLAYAPWRLGVHRVYNHLQYPWVKGYKKHPILYTNFKYLDVDVAAQRAASR